MKIEGAFPVLEPLPSAELHTGWLLRCERLPLLKRPRLETPRSSLATYRFLQQYGAPQTQQSTRDTIFHSEEMWYLVTVMYPSIARLVHMSVDNETERTALACSSSFTRSKPTPCFFCSSNEMFVAEGTR